MWIRRDIRPRWTMMRQRSRRAWSRPSLPSAEVAREDRRRSLDPVTEFLAGRYGRWARGRNWPTGEADAGGGAVEVWCCSSDSVTTPDATATLVVEGGPSGMAWLAGRPGGAVRGPGSSGEHPGDLDGPLVLGAGVHPPGHGGGRPHPGPERLVRALQASPPMVPRPQRHRRGQAQAIVENAAGGRSGSWITPDVLVADTVSSRFAGGAGRTR